MESVEQAPRSGATTGCRQSCSVGGGSSIGLAKAIALNTSLPILAIPTTLRRVGNDTDLGEITRIKWERTGKDPIVKPKTVIYDAKLTVTLPAQMTVTVDLTRLLIVQKPFMPKTRIRLFLFFAEDRNRHTSIAASLPRILIDPNNLDARLDAQYGCSVPGTALGSVGMALHHKLCHTLGGSYNLPHAETHTVILPHVIAYDPDYAPEASA